MNSTIIKTLGFNSKKKATDHEMVANLANLKMVRLQHIEGFGPYSLSMRGFQGGRLEMVQKGTGKEYNFTPTKDRFGEDVFSTIPLVFYPDETTEQLLAVIPVTKYNKKKLAIMYGDGYCPKILDSELDKEIAEMSKKLKGKRAEDKDKEETLLDQAGEIAKLNKKIARMEAEAKTAAKRKDVIAKAASEAKAKATETEVNAFRNEIKTKVCDEKANLVENLMEQYGDDWEQSEEYEEAIVPEIEKRLQELLKEKGLLKDEND